MKIKYYTDPGHGWFAVKRSVLRDMLLLGSISWYSYERGQTVYLEEDCDAMLFFNKAHELGIEVFITEKHTDKSHPIRSYDHYNRYRITE